jgi:cell division protein FtsA
MITAIDIGTDSVRCVIAEATEAGLDVIGVGKSLSTGLKRGVVINIESTVSAIRGAVEAAELMAGREVTEAYCSITGSHIAGRNLSGVVAVRNNEVRHDDVARVLKAARAVKINEGRDCVHVLPVEYAVDDIRELCSPLGIAGVRLEAKVHMITAAKTAMDNIITCCNREGIRVAGLIFAPLAASETMLHADEKELGVVLADIGAGTTDFAVWFNGGVIQTGVVNIGGRLISDEIAVALRTPRGEAEQMKVKYGCAMSQLLSEDDTIEVPAVGGRKPQAKKRSVLAEVIEPGLEEIFTSIGEQVRRAGHEEHVSSGLVVTGGTARMKGITELGEQILGIPVRVGQLQEGEGAFGGVTNAVQDPTYAVAVGMVKMVARDQSTFEPANGPVVKGGWLVRFKDWVKEAFVS